MNQSKTNALERSNYGGYLRPRKNYLDFFSPLFSFIDDKDELNNTMRTDIVESDKEYDLKIEVPGIKKEDIKIELEEGYLKVSYSIKSDEKVEDKQIFHIERRRGYYSRDYFVGYEVKKEDIKAKLENGILNIIVPKITEKETKDEIHID